MQYTKNLNFFYYIINLETKYKHHGKGNFFRERVCF